MQTRLVMRSGYISLFMYRCPQNRTPQGFSADDTSEDHHTYEPMTFLVCQSDLNPATGAVLGERSNRASGLEKPDRIASVFLLLALFGKQID